MGKTESNFANTETFVRLCVQFENPFFDLLIFEVTFGRLTVQKLVVGASVDSQDSAQGGYSVLAGQSLDGLEYPQKSGQERKKVL